MVVVGLITGTGGVGLTVTTVVAVVVQVPFVAANVYVPAIAGVTLVSTGLASVEVKPKGPLHTQLVPDVEEESVTVPPGQTPALALGVAVTVQVDHLKTEPSLGGDECAV